MTTIVPSYQYSSFAHMVTATLYQHTTEAKYAHPYV